MFSQFIGWVGRGLNYDFCPSWNQYVYWLKRPVGWVVCAILFSGLVGLLIGPQGFVLMWAFIAFLIAGAVWPWLGMKGVSCRLEFDGSQSEELQSTSGRLIVVNGWPLPVFGLTVEGQFLQDIKDEDDIVALGLKRIPAWSESEFAWQFEPARRGILPQDTPVVSTGFPFGLYQSEKQIELNRKIIVWPKCEPLAAVQELSGTHFNIDGGFSDRPGHDGDVIGTRPYRIGDSTKHINWSKTASSGKLVVLERQTAAQKAIQVVVDLDPRHHRGLCSQSSYEWAIRIAATIVKHLHLHHSRIRIVCVGLPKTYRTEMTNVRGLSVVLNFLATLPTLEQLNTENPNPNSNSISSAVAHGDDQVYWIGSDLAYEDRIKRDSKSCDIVVSTETGQARIATNSPRFDGKHVVSIDNLAEASQEIQLGWERLSHNV